MLVPWTIQSGSPNGNFMVGGAYQSKWKSFETRSLKSKKPDSAIFSATFLTATFDCATTQTELDWCVATML